MAGFFNAVGSGAVLTAAGAILATWATGVRLSATVSAAGWFWATVRFWSSSAGGITVRGLAFAGVFAVRTAFCVRTLATLSWGAVIFLRTTFGLVGTPEALSQPQTSRAIQIVLIKYRVNTRYLPHHLLVDLC
jgi:hypothetical protein